MTAMIAKVMKAINDNRPMSDWPTVTELEKQARAVIKAMREPTQAMLEAGRMTVGAQYRDMINAALKEGA